MTEQSGRNLTRAEAIMLQVWITSANAIKAKKARDAAEERFKREGGVFLPDYYTIAHDAWVAAIDASAIARQDLGAYLQDAGLLI